MSSWIMQTFNGVSLGSILLMISLGLAFSFGLMKVINMAHGEFIMIGAYVTFIFQKSLGPALGGNSLGLWFLLSIPAAFIISGLMGMLLERLLIRHLYGRPLDTLLATWGVGLVLQQAARNIFGAPNVQVTSPAWLDGGLMILDAVLPYKRIFIIFLMLVSIAIIYVFLYRTTNGRRIRAVMQNREMAACLGVPSSWVDALTFGFGAGLAGMAGSILTLVGPIGPSIGTIYIVDAFLVVVLGGTGGVLGSIVAALLIGISNTLLELNTTTAIAKVLVFGLIILFLQLRPNGILVQQTR